MHPADQVVAFARLADSGVTVAAIAARFGVSERTVEQRLRLGNVAPELIEAYRADEIDLNTLMAFAVTTDHARQLGVWERVSAQGYRPSAWQVKRLLTEERVPAGTAVARFVGVDAYEAAGGPVLRDLFADEHESSVWLEDGALLNDLAMQQLQVTRDELATRWKWAEAAVEVDWSTTARYGRIHPVPGEQSDEETAEAERLSECHIELANLDDDDWTDELVEESDAIEQRLEAIAADVDARATFRPGDFAIGGVHRHRRARRHAPGRPGAGEAGRTCRRRRAPPPTVTIGKRAATPRATPRASTLPPSPRPWPLRPTPARRRARRRASGSGSPTISARSAPRS